MNPLLTLVAGRTSIVTDVQYNNLSNAIKAQLDQIIGGLDNTYVEVSSAYLALASDYTINCTANSFTVTLPPSFGSPVKVYFIKNSGAGIITLAADGAELIDGFSTQTIPAGSSIMVQGHNIGWVII